MGSTRTIALTLLTLGCAAGPGLSVAQGQALTTEQRQLIDAAVPSRAPAKPRQPRRLLVVNLQVRNGVPVQGGLPAGQTSAISAAMLVNLVPDDLYDAWITLDKADSGMKAVPATTPQDTGLDLKAFQNLGYTGEWFVFAGFVVFMWFRLARREAEAQRDAALGLLPSPAGGTPAESSGDEEAPAVPAQQPASPQ